MKILIVTDYFYPHWTGISKSLYYLIKANIEELRFDVLTTKYKKELKNQEKIFQTIIYREPYVFSMSRVKYSFLVILKFIQLIGNYDGVFINSPCSNIFPISLLTKIFNKKLFIFHQGDLILPKGIVNKILEKVFDVSTLMSFFISNKVSTYTKDYAINSRVIKPFINKFTPLLMPITINKKNNSKNNFVYKKLLKLKKENKTIFGFAGRFVEEKGFDILLDAIPKIVKINPNVHFVFAGDTKIDYEDFYKNNLNKILISKSFFSSLGLLKDNDLNFFYNYIDFIIVPSRSDCFPLVQVEAILSGKPAIVSNIPGARVLVKETGFGLIFKKNNVEDLKEKILIAIKKRDSLLKNKNKVLSILDINNNAKKIRAYFTK